MVKCMCMEEKWSNVYVWRKNGQMYMYGGKMVKCMGKNCQMYEEK